MRDLLALVRRHTVEQVRGPGARLLLLLLPLGLLATTVLVGARGARGSAFAFGLAWTGLLALGAASAAGARLPADRDSGREAWLASLRPPALTRRLAPALAGLGLALAVAILGAALLGLFGALLGVAPVVRESRSLDLGVLRVPRQTAHLIRVEPDRGNPFAPDSLLELELRPRYLLPAGGGAADAGPGVRAGLLLGWSLGGATGEVRLPGAGPARIPVPPQGGRVRLENRSQAADVVVAGAHLLGPPVPLAPTLLLAALALGIVAGVLAPPAVFVSRLTSAPTAVATGLVLALAGLLRPALADLVPATAAPTSTWGLAVVETAGRLAPDATILARVADAALGRALSVADLGSLSSPLLYGLVGLLLLLLPLPRRLERTHIP